MVKVSILAAMLLMLPGTLLAITADELREMSSGLSRDKQDKSTRVKTGDKGSLLNAEGNTAADPAPVETKTKKRKFSKQQQVKQLPAAPPPPDPVPAPIPRGYENPNRTRSKGTTAASSVDSQPTVYSSVNSNDVFVSDAVTPVKNYGIRIGTWMEGSINRNTSSAEPGLVEIALTADVIGDKRTLKAGTMLFAQKQYNTATGRLEMITQNAVTPSGQEFKVAGLIFDTTKVSGLSGIISNDAKKSVNRGMQKGLLAAAATTVRSLGGASPLAGGVGTAAESMIKDRDSLVDQATEQQITVYVSPQPVLIRVEQTF